MTGVAAQFASLRQVSLRGVDLSDVHFPSADLQAADLSGADLTRASFVDADLTGAKLDADLPDDIQWEGATCPDESKAPAEGCERHRSTP